MKLAINLGFSFIMLGLCLYLVWPAEGQMEQIELAFERLEWATFSPYLFAWLGLQAVVHVCRSLRWNHLLAPLGVRVPTGPLLAISSVGFMAILALPARLGEFVRPGLLRRRGVSASAALGTVAVERIVDGLLVSVFVFGAFFALRGPSAPGWMMPTAYGALGLFAAALVFLVFALWRAEATVRFCLKLSLLPRVSPRIAGIIEHKLLDMIRGFAVLRDRKNLLAFLAWSAVYWVANGVGVWVLALGFDLPLSLVGGFAVMGLVAVGISLPNAPGLVGQFQWLTLLGLSLYLPGVTKDLHPLYAPALAYAITQHLLQVIWYVGMGALGIASPYVSFDDLRRARRDEKLDRASAAGDDAPDAEAAG